MYNLNTAVHCPRGRGGRHVYGSKRREPPSLAEGGSLVGGGARYMIWNRVGGAG
jgi:hypothetical protein